jgi:hypothetical protein
MNNHREYLVTLKTYQNFVEENKTNKLDRWARIATTTLGGLFRYVGRVNEVFEKPREVEYDRVDTNSIYYAGKVDTVYYFKSKSGNEYRLDLIVYYDDAEQYLIGEELISVSFSLANQEATEENEDNYEKKTNLHEAIDIYRCVAYLIGEYDRDVIYSIGETLDDKKDNTYREAAKRLFPDYYLKYGKTKAFPPKTHALYFKKTKW